MCGKGLVLSFTVSCVVAQLACAQVGNPLDAKNADTGNPLDAGAAPAIALKEARVLDVSMNNVVAYTLRIPAEWTVAGQVQWSAGEWALPELTATVSGPGGAMLRWLPPAKYAYSETDPAYLRQLDEMGIPHPNQHERDGIAPPTDIGQFIADATARSRTDVTNVRLEKQSRDEATEAAIKKWSGDMAGCTVHNIVLFYEKNGVLFREELNVTYQPQPVLDMQPSRLYTYTISPNVIATAPAAQFEQLRPAFEQIGKSMKMTEQWFACRMNVLDELSAQRHAANMNQIAQTGEIIRRQGEQYGKISEQNHQRWMAANRQQ